jgi:hypothetical protein
MSRHDERWRRLALITALVERAPGQMLGRTAIVKLVYLLQVFRRVATGYTFSLYSYGPFDSDVLNDLDSAASLKGLQVRTVSYAVGYGYEVRPGPAADYVKRQAASWLVQHSDDIDWVVQKFGGRSASELELLATLIYVDRERAVSGQKILLTELVRQVRGVKPHFPEDYVTAQAQAAQAEGWLGSVAAVPRTTLPR